MSTYEIWLLKKVSQFHPFFQCYRALISCYNHHQLLHKHNFISGSWCCLPCTANSSSVCLFPLHGCDEVSSRSDAFVVCWWFSQLSASQRPYVTSSTASCSPDYTVAAGHAGIRREEQLPTNEYHPDTSCPSDRDFGGRIISRLSVHYSISSIDHHLLTYNLYTQQSSDVRWFCLVM